MSFMVRGLNVLKHMRNSNVIFQKLSTMRSLQQLKTLNTEYIERINASGNGADKRKGMGEGAQFTVEKGSLLVERNLHSSFESTDLESIFDGASSKPFSQRAAKILTAPLEVEDVEIKGDGMLFLPEIKYRRILTAAFGSGGWAMVPRSGGNYYKSESDNGVLVTREFALFCEGRFAAQAVGEHILYGPVIPNLGKAMESAKSNALTRCCKDLCIASELWDKKFIDYWLKTNAVAVWCVNVKNNEKRKIWRKKDSPPIDMYPWKEGTR